MQGSHMASFHQSESYGYHDMRHLKLCQLNLVIEVEIADSTIFFYMLFREINATIP